MKVIKAEDTRSLEPFRDRIIEGDCLEVMKSIPGESIDMILCDLPYGSSLMFGELLPGLPYLRNEWNAPRLSARMNYCLIYGISETGTVEGFPRIG